MRDAGPAAPGSYCFYSPRRNASGLSRVLIPLIDMINHAGAGHNAHVAEAADGSISATATRDIAAGEEARLCTVCAEPYPTGTLVSHSVPHFLCSKREGQ